MQSGSDLCLKHTITWKDTDRWRIQSRSPRSPESQSSDFQTYLQFAGGNVPLIVPVLLCSSNSLEGRRSTQSIICKKKANITVNTAALKNVESSVMVTTKYSDISSKLLQPLWALILTGFLELSATRSLHRGWGCLLGLRFHYKECCWSIKSLLTAVGTAKLLEGRARKVGLLPLVIADASAGWGQTKT